MGAAVPVAEPQWSGAHQGLALFLGRLLAPLGDRPMAAPVDGHRPDGMLGPTLPAAALQASRGISYSFCCKCFGQCCVGTLWCQLLCGACRAHLDGTAARAMLQLGKILPDAKVLSHCAMAQQEVEDRLRLLSAFLGDVLARARSRADAGRGWSGLFDGRGGGGRGASGQPAAKRPRVEEAAKQELARCGALGICNQL